MRCFITPTTKVKKIVKNILRKVFAVALNYLCSTEIFVAIPVTSNCTSEIYHVIPVQSKKS